MTAAPDSPAPRRAEVLARRLRMSEGQLYTCVVGLLVAFTASWIGIPPTLADRTLGGGSEPLAGPPSEAAADQDPPPVEDPDAEEAEGVDDQVMELPDAEERPARDEASVPTEPAAEPEAAADPPEPVDPEEVARVEGGPPAAFGTVGVFAELGPPAAPDGIATMAGVGAVFVASRASVGDDGDRGVVFELDDGGSVIEEHHLPGVEDGLRGLASDGDLIYALSADPPRVVALEPGTGEVRTVADIPDLPSCIEVVLTEPCHPSPVDRPPAPRNGVLHPDGHLYVTDGAQATLWQVARDGGDVEIFYQDPRFASLERGLSGVAIDNDGHLVLTVEEALGDGANGAVYRLEVDDGEAGSLDILAITEADDAPAGVVVGVTGAIYVALSGSNAVLVLDEDSEEDEEVRLPDDDGLLSTPIGLAFHGESLLVTNLTADSGGPAQVHRIAVHEGPATPAAPSP